MGWKAASLLALALVGPAAWAEEAALGTTSTGPGPGGQVPPQQPVVVVANAEEAQLKERALARWQALIKGDFDAAYQFETPAYRAVYTQRQFQYQFGAQIVWRMADLKNIHYDNPSVARVEVEVAYLYGEPEKKDSSVLNTTSRINEVWLLKDGQWWHQQS